MIDGHGFAPMGQREFINFVAAVSFAMSGMVSRDDGRVSSAGRHTDTIVHMEIAVVCPKSSDGACIVATITYLLNLQSRSRTGHKT